MTFSWAPSIQSHVSPVPKVIAVLYQFDGPKMVLAHDDRGRQLLGVASDEDDAGIERWVFAPAPPDRVVAMLKTRAGLRAFFDSGSTELFDIRPGWSTVQSWTLAPDEVPEELLPERDAELPELTDEFRDGLIVEQRRLIEQRNRIARTRMLFDGRPVRARRSVSAGFAGDALKGYQDLVSLVYGHQTKGGLRGSGPIPDRDASTLMVADMPRGSVGFELVEDVDQGQVLPTGLSHAVAEVGELIGAAASSDTAYAESIGAFGSRIGVSLHAFLSVLRNAEATMKLEIQGREYTLDDARIADAVERTTATLREENDRPVVGTLIGFLPTDRRFELQTADSVVKGKIAKDADAAKIATYFQKRCTAHLHVVTVERVGSIAEAFTLLHATDPP